MFAHNTVFSLSADGGVFFWISETRDEHLMRRGAIHPSLQNKASSKQASASARLMSDSLSNRALRTIKTIPTGSAGGTTGDKAQTEPSRGPPDRQTNLPRLPSARLEVPRRGRRYEKIATLNPDKLSESGREECERRLPGSKHDLPRGVGRGRGGRGTGGLRDSRHVETATE